MPLQPFAGLNTRPDLYNEAFLQYTDPGGGTKSVIFDAVLTEDWSEPATVTEHPVEKGANITDHVRVQAITCKLKIRVTNEPIDSNMFADPVGGAGETAPLPITIPTPDQVPFDGVVDVPLWKSNQTLAIQVGNLANIVAGIAEGIVSDALAGNKTAAAIKPINETLQTGNDVIAYPEPIDLPFSGKPVQSISTAAGVAVADAITSLVPPGEEIIVPVPTDAGLAPHAPITPVIAQTVQFPQNAAFVDFAALLWDLLSRLKDAATIFTVYGSKKTLSSMVIDELDPHRGAPEDTGTGAEITLSLRQVRIVATNTVAAPLPNLPRAKTPINAGAQDPTPTDPKAMKSVGVKILDGILNLLAGGKLPGSPP